MRIQHNIMAMSAYRNYTNNVSAMKKNLEKLSSGYKINRAGDDAAGLAISEKMRAQITGLETAQKNAKDGISLVQTAEGALTEVHDMLNRMVELATQSANGTYDNTTDRHQMQKELDQLRSEINRIADSSNFNGIKLLDGSMSSDVANPIKNVAVDNVQVDAKTTITAAAASQSAFGNIGSVAATGAGNYGNTILHSDGVDTEYGKFELDLTGLEVLAPASGTAGLSIKFGGATIALKASAASIGMTANKIAEALRKDAKFIAISSSGTITVGTSVNASSVKSAANALVYQAATGADGKVTYKLYGQTAQVASTVTQIASGSGLDNMGLDVAKKLEGAASKNLNMKVEVAAGTNGTLTDNRQNKGTLQVQQTVVKAEAGLGNAVVSLDLDKIKDGTVLKIGNKSVVISIGSKSKADAVKAAFASAGHGTATVLNLSKYADASGALKSANKADIVREIANSLDDAANIRVGANASGTITLSEAASNGNSIATSDAIKTAMEKKETFQKLLETWTPGETAAVDNGFSKIQVDADKIFEGNSIKITASDGTNTTTKTYEFTADKDKLAKQTEGSKVYVDISDRKKIVENLAKAIASTAAVDGDTITIAYDRANGSVTSDDFKYSVAAGNDAWKGNTGLRLQIGDTAEDFNQLTVDIKDMHTKAMGDGTTSIHDISIANQEDAADAVDVIKAAINYVSDMRGTLGATQNRLDHTINNLSVMTENIQDAESTIRDVDVAEEMMAYTKNNILIQSAQAMLAQANQVPQGVLQLLQ